MKELLKFLPKLMPFFVWEWVAKNQAAVAYLHEHKLYVATIMPDVWICWQDDNECEVSE